MHKIQEKEFTWDDFSWEHLRRVRSSHLGDTVPTLVMECTINGLNFWRNRYLDYDRKIKGKELSGDESIFSLKEKQREAWWQMIQLLPSSYNQTRNVMMNYEVLANIYKSRKDHKLDEWCTLCSWISTLPYSELITEAYKKSDEQTKDVYVKMLDILKHHAKDRATLCDITDIAIWLEEEQNILCNDAEYRSWEDVNNHVFNKDD